MDKLPVINQINSSKYIQSNLSQDQQLILENEREIASKIHMLSPENKLLRNFGQPNSKVLVESILAGDINYQRQRSSKLHPAITSGLTNSPSSILDPMTGRNDSQMQMLKAKYHQSRSQLTQHQSSQDEEWKLPSIMGPINAPSGRLSFNEQIMTQQQSARDSVTKESEKEESPDNQMTKSKMQLLHKKNLLNSLRFNYLGTMEARQKHRNKYGRVAGTFVGDWRLVDLSEPKPIDFSHSCQNLSRANSKYKRYRSNKR